MRLATTVSSLLLLPLVANSFKLHPVASVRDAASQQVICNTPACVEHAAKFLFNMNRTADPCEDFNEYVCGGYFKNTEIPAEEKSVGTSFFPISQELFKRARTLLEEPIDETKDWKTDIMAKKLYQSCMDQDTRDEQGSQPLKDVLDATLDGWPVVEGADWDDAAFNWEEANLRLRDNGLSGNYLISMGVSTDLTNSKKHILYIGGPSLGLSRDYLVNGTSHPRVKHYYNLMLDTVEYLGADREQAEEEMKQVLRFEMELANLTLTKEEKRNITLLLNLFQIKDLPHEEGHPTSWLGLIKDTTFGIFDELGVDENEKVIVTELNYLKSVARLLKITPNRVIANYFGWRMSAGYLSSLDSKAKEIAFNYKKATSGVQKEKPQWKTCTSTVGFNSGSSSTLKIAAGSMYARRYFPEESKAIMVEMIDYLKGAFGQLLEDIDWMAEETKEKARSKLSVMKQKVAYPPEILDKELIEAYFAGVDLKEDQYIVSVLKLAKMHRLYGLRDLRKPVDPNHWLKFTSIALVNAFADFSTNSIVFPAGILQGTFFNSDLPNYLNYAAIGGVIGHEITHNFDDIGNQFDEDGNVANWWDKETTESFKQKAQCIVHQYGNYTTRVGLNLNGINTQGENIADNGGVKQAYYAYENWVKDRQAEPILPGLDLSQKQLFWVAWGNNWCTKEKDEYLKQLIVTDSHSPGAFRTNGPLSNSEEFARDFQCPVGSKMNPVKKCQVW